MKLQLRNQFRRAFSELAPDVWARQCKEIEDELVRFCLGRGEVQAGGIVTLFGGLRDEVDLVANVVARLLEEGFRPALFGLRQDLDGSFSSEMDAHLIDELQQVRRGQLGVWEPDVSKTARVNPDQIAAIMVPGLFFSPQSGARLGRGGGFFDRYLARTPASVVRVGIGMEWQMREELPVEAHDQRMDWLVTNRRHIRCH